MISIRRFLLALLLATAAPRVSHGFCFAPASVGFRTVYRLSDHQRNNCLSEPPTSTTTTTLLPRTSAGNRQVHVVVDSTKLFGVRGRVKRVFYSLKNKRERRKEEEDSPSDNNTKNDHLSSPVLLRSMDTNKEINGDGRSSTATASSTEVATLEAVVPEVLVQTSSVAGREKDRTEVTAVMATSGTSDKPIVNGDKPASMKETNNSHPSVMDGGKNSLHDMVENEMKPTNGGMVTNDITIANKNGVAKTNGETLIKKPLVDWGTEEKKPLVDRGTEDKKPLVNWDTAEKRGAQQKPLLSWDTPQNSSSDSIWSRTDNLPELSAMETLRLKNLYDLPPVDRNLTKLEQEFRGMLEVFSQFTEADLYTIRDPRIRTIFAGVIASSNEPAVYRAFEILFEDLVPLRIAGRMIFAKLKEIMSAANSKGQKEVDAIVATTGLPPDRVEVSRLAFLTLSIATENGHDEEAHLTLEQLVDSGLAETTMSLLGYDDVGDFLNNIDRDQRGKVSFTDLMIGLQMIAEETCSLDRCDPAIVLQSLVDRMEPTLSNNKIKLDKRRQEYSDKYDQMVDAFKDWSDFVPTGEGRRLDVLRGCFVGASNKRVVEALRVVYMDYAALRVAGNSIFSLMQALITQMRKRSNNLSK